MSALIGAEIWGELKRYINVVDRGDAALQMVNIMIDHDIDVDEITDAFKSDSDIKRALTSYLDNDRDYSDEDEEEAEEEDYDDWEN
jgi:membrane protein involved in colicin uptake